MDKLYTYLVNSNAVDFTLSVIKRSSEGHPIEISVAPTGVMGDPLHLILKTEPKEIEKK